MEEKMERFDIFTREDDPNIKGMHLFTLGWMGFRNQDWFDVVASQACSRARVTLVNALVNKREVGETKGNWISASQKIYEYDYLIYFMTDDEQAQKFRSYLIGWVDGHFTKDHLVPNHMQG